MHTSFNLIPNEKPVNLLSFTDFSSLQNLNANKPYTPITTCVLQHILTTTHLCDLEKLYYMLADSLSLINYSKGKQRSITLSARQWAEKLNCSIAEIFAIPTDLTLAYILLIFLYILILLLPLTYLI